MKFILNEGLVETPRRYSINPDQPFGALQRDIDTMIVGQNWQKLKVETAAVLAGPVMEGVEAVQKGYLGILADSYSRHVKITLSPHDVWFLLLTEIADIVEKNVDACRPIFTQSPEKIEILVPTDDVTAIDLNYVEAKLRSLVPVDINIFIPSFSTITPQARYACLAAFCDSASNYYDYSTFCCGIPEIKIDGTRDDWALLQTHATQITNILSNVGLSFVNPWLSRASAAIDRILTALDTGSPDTLQTILTQTRVGSGGQQAIDGWFVDFYLKNLRGKQIEGFPNTWARVPYKNLDTGRKFIGIHGCLLTRRDAEGFVYGDYSEIVTERRAREDDKIKITVFHDPLNQTS